MHLDSNKINTGGENFWWFVFSKNPDDELAMKQLVNVYRKLKVEGGICKYEVVLYTCSWHYHGFCNQTTRSS